MTSKDADGTELAHVSYAYDAFDNMTEIVRGDGMKYSLAYNEFHNLKSIGIEGKNDGDLITYTYKNGNGRLKEMKYANGDVMKATYNSIGQIVAEKWYDSTNSLTAHYKYTYDGAGSIVRSIDISGKKEYNYEYEEGRIVRATEADIELTGEIVTSRVIVNTINYCYNKEIELYYLQSRYYDASVGRFLNIDDTNILITVFDDTIPSNYNLSAYCLNSPTNNADSNGKWLARLVCGIASAALFATLAYVVCKVVNIFTPVSKKVTAAITVACGALGGIIGAALGVSFLAKHAPKLLQAIQKIEKTRFSLKAIGPNTGGNIFGIVISNTLIIMLHAPHPKYNEWYFHIQVEVKLGKKQIPIWKKPIVNVNPKTWGK